VALSPEDLPPELRDRAGSLGLAPTAVEPTLTRLLAALGGWLARPDAEILAGFGARDALQGQIVDWGTGRGRAHGVDDQGRLRVIAEDGREDVLSAGEVHLVGG
jgi:biotin-(acetyl-CoA carboxylase) ligase